MAFRRGLMCHDIAAKADRQKLMLKGFGFDGSGRWGFITPISTAERSFTVSDISVLSGKKFSVSTHSPVVAYRDGGLCSSTTWKASIMQSVILSLQQFSGVIACEIGSVPDLSRFASSHSGTELSSTSKEWSSTI